MLKIKKIKDSSPAKFSELPSGETFSCSLYFDEDCFFIKVGKLKNDLNNYVNAIGLIDGKQYYFNEDDEVRMVKINCEIEYF